MTADYSYLMSRSDLEESGTWNLEGNKLISVRALVMLMPLSSSNLI